MDVQKLSSDRYLVPISYEPVSSKFDDLAWENRECCVGVEETPGVKEFWLACLPGNSELDETWKIVAWGDAEGYRPALRQEAVEFVRACSDIVEEYISIAALGSHALVSITRGWCVPVFYRGDPYVVWVGSRWHGGDRFLFVRK